VVLDDPLRKYCDECLPERRVVVEKNFACAGPAALAKRRADGSDPAHTEEARRKQGLRAAANVRANFEWENSNGHRAPDVDFQHDILPGIRSMPLSQIMEATGLSLRYCSLIRRGSKVPHRRHWDALAASISDSNP
jgi:hypothetical protein